MASTGAKLPTSGTSVSASPWSDNAWTSPGNVTAIDSTYASVTASTFDTNDQTHRLRCVGFDFSSIPDGSTINGISVTIHNARYANGSGSIDLAQLVEGGAPLGDNKYSTPQALTKTATTDYSLGGTSDLWGATLTAAIVKSSTFGIDIGCLSTAENTDVFIDAVEMTVEYTAPVGTTYDDDLTDSGAASESVSTTAVFAESVTDTAAATDDAALPPVVFFVIYASAGSAPSAAQVKAGQDATSSAAVAHGHEVARTTTGEQVFADAATGLTAGTSYRVAFVWSDWTDDSNVAVSDAWSTTAAAIDESASDTAAATETITAALVIALSAADAADATETVAGALVVTESASDTAAAADQASTEVTASVAATAAAQAADAATGSVVVEISVSDAGSVSDAVASTRDLAAQASDAGAATDSAGRAIGIAASASDSANTADAVQVLATLGETASDAAVGSDTASSGSITIEDLSDAAQASDVGAAVLQALEAPTDQAAASEAAASALDGVESVEDLAGAGAAASASAVLTADASDGAAATESVLDEIGATTINESAGETVGASDQVASTLQATAGVVGTAEAADSAVAQAQASVAAADQASVSDSATAAVVAGVSALDAVAADEVAATALVVAAQAIDAATATDDIQAEPIGQVFDELLADACSVLDQVGASAVLGELVPELAACADLVFSIGPARGPGRVLSARPRVREAISARLRDATAMGRQREAISVRARSATAAKRVRATEGES